MKDISLHINSSFTEQLAADKNENNTPRQVSEAAYSYANPIKTSKPQLIHSSPEVGQLLGFSPEDLTSEQFLRLMTGNENFDQFKPYAMCYGGHQFGHWAGQLGDGRAINIAETKIHDSHWVLQLKGAGPTPYSRTADGLAVLRSSIREYLCSEAMFHLGVPTTRALSLALSGDEVLRDMMYDGNPAMEKGAIVCRVAPSFIRFGNFEIFAARRDTKNLQRLLDYTLQYHYPHLGTPNKESYLKFFQELTNRTLDMVIHWQRVGFVHGVMNTDNFSALGLTIDYGPYGWLEGYDHNWTPNTTDKAHRRYRYGNQAQISLWNLAQLGNAIYPLIEEAAPLEAILQSYQDNYLKKYYRMMSDKLGLENNQDGDVELISQLEKVLQLSETDMTIFFRLLSNVDPAQSTTSALTSLGDAFYDFSNLQDVPKAAWIEWLDHYLQRLYTETRPAAARKTAMNQVNPKYVLRNYMAQLAIDQANNFDFSLIHEFYQLLKNPYAEQTEYEKWFAKRPEWARNKVGCSMLSCSS